MSKRLITSDLKPEPSAGIFTTTSNAASLPVFWIRSERSLNKSLSSNSSQNSQCEPRALGFRQKERRSHEHILTCNLQEFFLKRTRFVSNRPIVEEPCSQRSRGPCPECAYWTIHPILSQPDFWIVSAINIRLRSKYAISPANTCLVVTAFIVRLRREDGHKA